MMSIDIMKVKLVKESSFNYGSVGSASDAVEIFKSLMKDAAEEFFWMLCLDCKGNVIGAHEVSHGELSSSTVHPREIFKRALLNNASAIIVSHNHPSGDPEPSMADIALTSRIVECSKLIGIRLLDHIIIGDNYYSFSGNGMLEE